jgi:gluconokinase
MADDAFHPPFMLALDIGTSSVRAILYDCRGAITDHMAQVTYDMDTSQDGGAYIDADWLLAVVATTLDQFFTEADRPQISGVAVTTFWHNILGVGSAGQAVTPLISWADTRPGSVIPQLKERLDEKATHDRTGCVLHPSYLPAKLLWLADHHPDTFTQAEQWMSIGEYLFLRLFGKTGCSISMASGTGLLNAHTCTWDMDTLSALPIEASQLSRLTDLNEPFMGLKDLYGTRWPALKNLPWYPAVGDGACSNIGSGCVTTDRMAIMVGTSGAMRVMWPAETFTIPEGLWCYRSDRRRILMGGALSNGGNVYGWMRSTLQLGENTTVEQAIATMAPDTHGLTVLPFWAGERSPGWHASARATITGMTLHTTPIDIMRASLEATAYCFASIYERLQSIHVEAKEMIASGAGLLQSPAWLQMMADVLGRPVIASAVSEASSRGAALLALEACGRLADLAEAPVPLDKTYDPDMANHTRYREAMARQQDLYEILVSS